MTDRELLEKAAKAAGVQGHFVENCPEDGAPKYSCGIGNAGRITPLWNPLTDDGDALWLAVTLRLTISWDRYDDEDYATATPPHTHQGYDCLVDQDPYVATRRAIVRAAAALADAGGRDDQG